MVPCCAAYVCVCESWMWPWLCARVCGGGDVISVYWSPAAWCLRNEGVSSVLLGASNTDQLMENIGAIQVRPLNLLPCFSFFTVPAEHIKSFPFSKEWDGGHLIWFIFVPSSVKRQFFCSRVQLVLLGSSPLHALLLYCTTLIRSAQYHLPRGLETSSQPLLSLLIRLALLMGFAYWWGSGCSLHIIPGPQWTASPPPPPPVWCFAFTPDCVYACAHYIRSHCVHLIFRLQNVTLTFPEAFVVFLLPDLFIPNPELEHSLTCKLVFL